MFDLEYEGQECPTSAIVVDAATSGNPGLSMYKGILLPTGEVLFEKNIGYATNNVAEYIALIHGLAYSIEKGLNLPVYSDSKTALAWIKNGVNTSLHPSPKTKVSIELLKRAQKYREKVCIKENQEYFFWEAKLWGENPADFGNKNG